MNIYNEPTETEFQSSENTLQTVMKEYDSTLATSKGSVIRELLIRPAAFVYSWVSASIQALLYKASVSYLSTSQATENAVADAVASNYFITRRNASKATGVVTVTLNQAVVRIPKGARFTIAGEAFETPSLVIISNTELTGKLATVTYVTATPVGSIYMANVPVTASNAGSLEIPVGSDVVIGFSAFGLVSAELTSAITGGGAVETDASMMERAKYAVADGGTGSYYGLRKKLAESGLPLVGLSVEAGESASMFRARYNNIAISPSGFVDLYAKTQNQASTLLGVFPVTETTSGVYTARVESAEAAGCFAVLSVVSGGVQVAEFTTAFSTESALTGDAGARLSTRQIVTISFEAETGLTEASVTVSYMPGIAALQSYMESDDGRFVGQDVLVKAAVPATVGMRCAVQSVATLTASDLTGIRNTISAYINALPVGQKSINFSDVAAAVATVYPSAVLRLPCVFTASVILRDGSSDAFSSATGMLDLSWMSAETHWPASVCFMSASPSGVEVVQI